MKSTVVQNNQAGERTQQTAVIKPPQELSNEAGGVVAWAKELSITSQADYDQAVEKLKVIKLLTKRAIDFFKPMKQRADESKRAILDAEKQIIDPLYQAERMAKNAVLTFSQEQERAREIERKRLQAIADEAARKEKARIVAAATKLKTPEKREAKLEAAESVVAPIVIVAPAIRKAEGTNTRTIWKARIVDADAVPRQFLMVNDKALDAFAKNTKGTSQVAGVEFYSEESLVIGAR